ncbi:lipoyl(octanoyl) transferase LipB [Kingella negevensis]|uniref:lipoyl(octanoyl) transferase LipB n=1 Tax=Kingella negevensis TaxID=1522312 RepID=UPI00254378FC|nr:lipoyl(octanoyl) transferase LipB [Kingella negevensis]MDK4679891.1 lipoyl(octanoyl) transferase LipB [Kingella negevensis]MDK4682390.1 lipoyl(octanoyl) transferase LipB [Kingella negevensis]MDK4690587.1 lipoyl(octanoyl) transferase LipB [Kingella negevensis]MDK4692065.1 lipoyl(octanoyl) transferase LipB [Kingella negevensis]MDK4700554.1 lipoyl(octanoyl) transferase LipB [Kingella negevensis]
MKIIKLGLVDYQPTFEAMKKFNAERTPETEDELWLVEHPPVFTQGLAGKPEHLLLTSDIPVVQIDRGGQITYHGPGQLVVYTMINFKRRHTSVRKIVSALENSIIATLAEYGIDSANDPDRPGVYVCNRKIASLGLRIKDGSVYHGLALNVNMDLEPFHQINPCGYAGLEMTQIRDYLNPCPTWDEVAEKLSKHLLSELDYEKLKL